MKRLSACLIFSICFLPPFFVIGIFDLNWPYFLLYLSLWVLVIGYLSIARDLSPKTQGLILLLASSSLTLWVIDLAARPLLSSIIWYRPHDMAFHVYPKDPSLTRYYPNTSFCGEVFGDLAAMSGNPSDREYRRNRFTIDLYGFRNEPSAHKKVIDFIVLGDSYGTGDGTTQDKTWASLFEKYSGKTVYNLSMPGSPRDEFLNLKIESPMLKMSKQSVVLWAIFSGNDLTDGYGDLMPNFQGWWRNLQISLANFRANSPIKRFYDRSVTYRRFANPDKVIRSLCHDRQVLFFKPYIDMARMTRDEVVGHVNFQKLATVMSSMKNFSDLNNLSVWVLFLPSKEEIYSFCVHGKDCGTGQSAFGEAVKLLCEQTGLKFFDFTPEIIAIAREDIELLWWRDDTHMNEKGNEAVAKILFGKYSRTISQF